MCFRNNLFPCSFSCLRSPPLPLFCSPEVSWPDRQRNKTGDFHVLITVTRKVHHPSQWNKGPRLAASESDGMHPFLKSRKARIFRHWKTRKKFLEYILIARGVSQGGGDCLWWLQASSLRDYKRANPTLNFSQFGFSKRSNFMGEQVSGSVSRSVGSVVWCCVVL